MIGSISDGCLDFTDLLYNFIYIFVLLMQLLIKIL